MSNLDLRAVSAALTASEAPQRAKTGLNPEHRRALEAALRRTGRSRAERRRGGLASQAVAAVDSDRNLEGARLALKAIEEDPEALPAYLAGGVALDRLGYRVEALSFYEQALMRAPNDPTIAALLGACALRMGEFAIAERCYRVAAQLEPNDWAHQSNLGGALRDQGRFAEAIDVLRNAIYLHPQAPDLWNTLGTVLQEQGEPEQSLVFLEEAVRLKPGFARAFHNLGSSLTDLARYDEACAAFDAALRGAAAATDQVEMRHARAAARLGAGRVSEGWSDYEARLDPLAHDAIQFQLPKPRWRGEPLEGKRLLVIGEQGLGDEILFMNAAPDALAAVGPEGLVTVACDRRLIPLFQRSFPGAEATAHATAKRDGRTLRTTLTFDEWERIDFWAPMGDLPARFRPTIASFPSEPGFLKADPARVAKIAAMLSGDLRVGIVWKSLVMTPKRARYFAPFEAWGPIFKTPGATFYSLQYGDTAAETALARERFGVELRTISDLDLKDDLDGVAAAGVALDLVIAPMNASSNLAAACGGEVWFVHRSGSWTMLGTEAAPWYPQTRAFWTQAGDWDAMFADIAAALARRAAPPASAA
jgi:tetratricopeptide (TPR) repeat protein